MGLKEDSVKGVFWNFIGLASSQLRNFIVSLFLARILSPSDFGLVTMALLFSAIMESFVDFGLGNAIIKSSHVTQTQTSTVFYINLGIGVLLTITMYVIAPLISNFFDMPQLYLIIQTMSVIFIIKAFEALPMALFRKALDFKSPFKIQLISSSISGLTGIVLALNDYGVWALVLSQILGWILSVISIWYYSSWRPTFEFDLSGVKPLLNFGYKYVLTRFTEAVFNRVDTIVVGKVFSVTTLGVFDRAKSLYRLMIQYAFNSYASVLFPTLCTISHDIKRLTIYVNKITGLICFLSCFISGLIYVCADQIIPILYGNQWGESIGILRIFILFTLCETLAMLLTSLLQSIGEVGKNLKIEFFTKALRLSAIPFGMLYGLTCYIIIVNLVSVLRLMIYIYNLHLIKVSAYKYSLNMAKYILPFILILLLNKVVWFNVQDYNYFVALILNGLIYAALYVGWCLLMRYQGLLDFLEIIKFSVLKIKKS